MKTRYMANTAKSDLRNGILHYLSIGKPKAITGSFLALLLGHKSDRAIRLMIRDLIDDGLPIAASVDKPKGYYLASDKREAQEYIQLMQDRIREDALRLKSFKMATLNIRVPEQIKMEL